jgi:nucleoside-diphosphate-sugar epimerase
VDAVYHLAAYAKAWSRRKSNYWNINAMGTQHLLDACLKNKVKKVVITSSAGNFGPSISGIVTEKTQRLVPFFTDYERSKNDADLIAMEYADRGLYVVLTYPTRVFGPQMHGSFFGINALIEKMVRHNFRWVPGTGSSIGNYAFVNDVVHGLIQAMEHGISGESYILGGTNKTYDEFYESVFELAGKEVRLKHLPTWLLGIVVQLESFKSVLGMKPRLSKDWMAKVTYNWEVSSAKAAKELHYKTTDFNDAMQATITQIYKDKK